jgi:phage shock protein E
MLRRLLAPLAAAVLLLGLTSCATAQASTGDGTPAVAIDEGTILIDVRTPAEYAAGHLKGAVLLDLNGGEFAKALPSFDLDADYLVYCRSGNRSGQAVAMMEQARIGSVTNLGSIEDAAAATGLAIVTR